MAVHFVRTRIRALRVASLCLIPVLSGATEARETALPSIESPAELHASRDFHSPDSQLAELIRILLEENPEIQQAQSISRSRQERVPQERSLPDPQLTYRMNLRTPETRVGPQTQGLEISQGIPWFGKRALQAERAGHLASGAAWHARGVERRLVAELKRAYFDLGYLQEALAINADEARLLDRFEHIALTRYATGSGIQQSVIKVQTDITRLSDQKSALQERLRVGTRHVAELLGRPGPELILRPIQLSLPEPPDDRTELEREALARSPRIFESIQQIEADTSWVRRRERNSFPDFSFGLAYAGVDPREDPAGVLNPPQDNGRDTLAIVARLNLPLHRARNRAGVAEAEHRLDSNRQALRRTENRLRYEVQESLLRLDSFVDRARQYRDVLIPQAGESLASAEAAYTTNRQTFLDLLDAERVLFQVRRTYQRLLADSWIALADLERVVARPVPNQRLDEEERP